MCVCVVNCEGEDGRPYLLRLVVVRLKNCFHYQVEGFSHANYQYHCEVAFLLIQTSLSDQKERKIVLVLYQTFCSDNGKSYLMKYCTDHTTLPFTAGEKETEQTNGWGCVSLLVVFGLRGLFFFLLLPFFFLVDTTPKCQSKSTAYKSILTSLLLHWRNRSDFVDMRIFVSLLCALLLQTVGK